MVIKIASMVAEAAAYVSSKVTQRFLVLLMLAIPQALAGKASSSPLIFPLRGDDCLAFVLYDGVATGLCRLPGKVRRFCEGQGQMLKLQMRSADMLQSFSCVCRMFHFGNSHLSA